MSMLNRRTTERVDCELKVGYEFVKWNEQKLEIGKKQKIARSYDISASGIGLTGFEKIPKGTEKKLIKGDLKLRLAIELYSDAPLLIIFARFIWNQDNELMEINSKRCGCTFLDESMESYTMLHNFVHGMIREKSIQVKGGESSR